jgi:hypothetical protein
MKPGRFHRHSPLLSSLLLLSKLMQSLERIVLAGTTRDRSALTILSGFFYPVAMTARNNDEVDHEQLLQRPCRLQRMRSRGLDARRCCASQ